MTLLSDYNIRLQCYQSLIILSNQTSGFIDQRYFMDRYACTILIFFSHVDRHTNYINKERHKNKKCVNVKCGNSQGMQKMSKKWEEPSFSKVLSLIFDKFGFQNFVDINIEKFTGINFAIVVTETLYF